jgi:RND family efflux transporter MFP subunit
MSAPDQMPATTDRAAPGTDAAVAGQGGGRTVPAVIPPQVPPPSAQDPAAPVRPRRLWPWIAGLVLAAGLGGALYLQPWVPQAVPVVVETAAPGPVTRVLAVNGRIASVQSVDVRPQVSGTLDAVLVDDGDPVQPGQVLVRLDAAAQQAFLRQAAAGLDAALVAQEDARATYDRTDALGTNAARVVLESAARAVQAAAQEVVRMTALLDQAQIQLEKFTIRAPIAGTVLDRSADPGQSVDPATVLMTIVDMGRLIVETDVDESYATQIRTGQPALLQLSGETAVREGHVSFVSQKVDEATGGLAVELTPDVPVIAPIGLTVTANITVDDQPSAITVPRAAIQREAEETAVLVVADGLAIRRAVTVIDWPAARLIVTDGLAAGDLVIADATGLAEGQAVMVAP